MTDMEVTSAKEVWLGYEDDGEGGTLPTLYDRPSDTVNGIRAVWLVGATPEQITVATDPEVVESYLGAMA
jgi:hypothetical protein